MLFRSVSQSRYGIYAEFAKIVCTSVGVIYFKGSKKHIRTKSFAGHDEVKLLHDFALMASKFLVSAQHYVCGHNIKEFDIPFICRRMLVNGITIPNALDVSGKKPWETSFIDTLKPSRINTNMSQRLELRRLLVQNLIECLRYLNMRLTSNSLTRLG